MTDVYPADVGRIIRDLQQRVDEALTIAKRIPAIPIERATGPFVIPSGSPPNPPAGAVVLYESGGRLMVKNSAGQVVTVENVPDIPFQQGSPVASPPVFNSPSNPQQTVAALHAAYQALRDDCQSGLRATVIALLQVLRAAGIIAT